MNRIIHEKEVEALLEAARAVLEFSNFAESARSIFDRAKEITGATAGYVALLSSDGSENEVLFLDAGGTDCTVDPDLPMPIRGLRAEAYEKGIAVFDNDFARSEWAKYLPEGHAPLKNVLFAPLIISGRVVGLIGLANKPTDFTERDARMASAFGEFASVALSNSRNLDKLRSTVSELQQALDEVQTLKGIIPICASCKRIRSDEGYWAQVEDYIHAKSGADFSHGLCPECTEKAFLEAEKTLEQMFPKSQSES